MGETTLLMDARHNRGDARMIEMAIRKGWKIPDSVLETLPSLLAGMIVRSDDDRTKIAASRVLVSMHQQNQQLQQPLTQRVEHHHEHGVAAPEGETYEQRRSRLNRMLTKLRERD